VYQTFQDIEVIVVNDSSPDERDGMIINEYEKTYPDRVRVFRHKKNLGVGEARKTAIRNACGEFLLFCDSDDFLDFTACEKMYAYAVKCGADMVVCDYYYLRDGIIGIRQVSNGIDAAARDYCPYMLTKTTVWVSLVKKSILVDNYLVSELRFGEDRIAVLWYLAAHKIAKIDEPLYYYVYRKSSLIGTATDRSAEETVDAFYSVMQHSYFEQLCNSAKCSVLFYAFRTLFGYWLNIMINDDKAELLPLFKKILRLEKIVDNYRSEICMCGGIAWEATRVNKILAFAEENMNSKDFNNRFREFYADMDFQIIAIVLERLKMQLAGRCTVFWAAGSYSQVLANSLKLAGIEYEITDLHVKDNTKKRWDELKCSTGIVLLSTSEFLGQVKRIVGDTEVIVLQDYLNEKMGAIL